MNAPLEAIERTYDDREDNGVSYIINESRFEELEVGGPLNYLLHALRNLKGTASWADISDGFFDGKGDASNADDLLDGGHLKTLSKSWKEK